MRSEARKIKAESVLADFHESHTGCMTHKSHEIASRVGNVVDVLIDEKSWWPNRAPARGAMSMYIRQNVAGAVKREEGWSVRRREGAPYQDRPC